jgi:hypothetical protein
VTEILPAPTVARRDQTIAVIDQILWDKTPSIGQITGRGSERYLVTPLAPSSTAGYKMDQKERAKANEAIINKENQLSELDSASQGAFHAIGILPRLKAISTNVFDPLVSWTGLDTTFMENARHKTELRKLSASIIKNFAQNPDRVSVYEQTILKDLAPDPDAWLASPKVALEGIRELYRLTRNDIEVQRARLENRAPLMIMSVPSGTASDPFTYDQHGAFTGYMINSGQGAFFNGKYVQGSEGGPPKLFGAVKQ